MTSLTAQPARTALEDPAYQAFTLLRVAAGSAELDATRRGVRAWRPARRERPMTALVRDPSLIRHARTSTGQCARPGPDAQPPCQGGPERVASARAAPDGGRRRCFEASQNARAPRGRIGEVNAHRANGSASRQHGVTSLSESLRDILLPGCVSLCPAHRPPPFTCCHAPGVTGVIRHDRGRNALGTGRSRGRDPR